MRDEPNGELEHLPSTVQTFAREVVTLVADHYEATKTFPRDLVNQAGQIAHFESLLLEEYGGTEADLLVLRLALEELGGVDQPAAITRKAMEWSREIQNMDMLIAQEWGF